MTIQQLMNAVNAVSGARMTFNTTTRAFTLESTGAGELNDLQIELNGSTLFADMGFNAASLDNNYYAGASDYRTRGAYAEFTLDGVRMRRETNNFVVDGLEITLTDMALLDGLGYYTFNFTTQNNIEPLIDTIREFVDGFNEMMLALHAAHTTPRPRPTRFTFFEPLTDDQRRAMSDTEIQRWEEQAMTGMLHRNQTVREIHAMKRRWMMEPVTLSDGTRMSLSQIGISTTRNSHMDGGILEIDMDRLRAALENDGERVMEMFTTQASEPANGRRNVNLQQSGIGDRLFNIAHWSTSATDRSNISIFTRAGLAGALNPNSVMSRAIANADRRLDDMQRTLQRREDQLFRQFSRMEQAMMQANNQMGAMMGMFGGGM
jgi:flagellar hook-associated protein 2